MIGRLKNELVKIAGKNLSNTIAKTLHHSVLVELRLNDRQTQTLRTLIKQCSLSLVIKDEIEPRGSISYFEAFTVLANIPLYFVVKNQLLHAGNSKSEAISSVVFPRVFRERFIQELNKNIVSDVVNQIPIYVMYPWSSLLIGSIQLEEDKEHTYLHGEDYDEIERDVKRVIDGEKDKTGIILYGPPGNGKSHYIRYLAKKYKLPIYIFVLEKDRSNIDIIGMFGKIDEPCIILMEDFDSYFKGRKALIQGCQFTFDGILNVIDGTYAQLKNTILVLTANNLNRIDFALKDRPSRFRQIQYVDYPSKCIREEIFASLPLSKKKMTKLIKDTEGRSLDQLLHIQDAGVRGDKIKIPNPPGKYEGIFAPKKEEGNMEKEEVKPVLSSPY